MGKRILTLYKHQTKFLPLLFLIQMHILFVCGSQSMMTDRSDRWPFLVLGWLSSPFPHPAPLSLPACSFLLKGSPSRGSWSLDFLHGLLSSLHSLVLKKAENFPPWPEAQLPVQDCMNPPHCHLLLASAARKCPTRDRLGHSVSLSLSSSWKPQLLQKSSQPFQDPLDCA